MSPTYTRVLLKLSGEALAGSNNPGIDPFSQVTFGNRPWHARPAFKVVAQGEVVARSGH